MLDRISQVLLLNYYLVDRTVDFLGDTNLVRTIVPIRCHTVIHSLPLSLLPTHSLLTTGYWY
jgi:hypothetical protein